MFLLFFREIYVNSIGNQEGNCSREQPCSYEKGKKEIQDNDFLFFTDNIINDSYLNKFKDIVDYSINKECKIQGNSTIINGTNFSNSPFLFIDGKASFSISGFKFLKFTKQVMHIRNTKNTKLNDISFDFCKNDNNNAIISFVASDSEINKLLITTSSAHDSSLITIFTSTVKFKDSQIFNNFLFHESKQPMIMVIRSNISFTSTNFNQNTSPVSPFIRLEDQCSLSISNSSFSMNKHAEIILDDSFNSKTELSESVFNDNHGIIFASVRNSSIDVSECKISDSGSYEEAMFIIMKSRAAFKATSFINCAGENLIKGISESSIKAEKLAFERCKPYHSVLNSDYNSSINISNCSFMQTIAKESVIFSERGSSVLVNNSLFHSSWSPAICFTGSSKIIVDNTSFNNSFAKGKRAAYGEKSSLAISNSIMNDQSLVGLIKNSNGTVSLHNIAFDAPQSFALSQSLANNCSDCKYGTYVIQYSNDTKGYLIFWCLLIAIIAFIPLVGKKKIGYFFRSLFRSKNVD